MRERVSKQRQNNKSARGIESLTIFTLLPLSSSSTPRSRLLEHRSVCVCVFVLVCGPNAFRPPDKQFGFVLYFCDSESDLLARKQTGDTNPTISEANK